jgi:hypothetical protein
MDEVSRKWAKVNLYNNKAGMSVKVAEIWHAQLQHLISQQWNFTFLLHFPSFSLNYFSEASKVTFKLSAVFLCDFIQVIKSYFEVLPLFLTLSEPECTNMGATTL